MNRRLGRAIIHTETRRRRIVCHFFGHLPLHTTCERCGQRLEP